jgi:hypothetical protein
VSREQHDNRLLAEQDAAEDAAENAWPTLQSEVAACVDWESLTAAFDLFREQHGDYAEEAENAMKAFRKEMGK